MATKMRKVNCSICGGGMLCPESMLKAKHHVCGECFEERPDKVVKLDPAKTYLGAGEEAIDEMMADGMAMGLADTAFDEIWKEAKKHLKGLAEKERARHLFEAGAHLAILCMLEGARADKRRMERGRAGKNACHSG